VSSAGLRSGSLVLLAALAGTLGCAEGDGPRIYGAVVDDDGGASTSSPGSDSGATTDAGADAGPPSGMTMGATIVDGGVAFRVWAPHATAAEVSGDLSAAPVPLAPEPGGFFAGKVDGAHAGQHYRFAFTTAGQRITRGDPRARATNGSGSDAVIVDPGAYAWKSPPFTAPPPSQAILYEMHVASFNVPAGAPSGTYLSAIDRLDHVRALGVNYIELMPILQFRGTTGWGYNPVAYFAPHATYGAPDDLRRFVDEAHSRGIGVLLDVVLNHYDRQRDGLWCFDGACPSDNGVYFFSDPAYAMTPWGPRPAYATKEVTDFLIDSLFGWLSEYRIDGFRWDSTSNIRAIDGSGSVPGGRELMARANATLHGLFPGALFVAEDYKGYAPMTAPTASGGVGFDAQWDGFSGSVNGAVTQGTDGARDVTAVRNVIAFKDNRAFDRVIFTENHDLAGNGGARLPTAIDGVSPTSWRARKNSMLAFAAVALSPGIPMLLQGQEILQTAQWSNGGTPPVQWNDATANAPVLAFYKDLLTLRRTASGLQGENVDVFHVNNAAKVLAWRRWSAPGDDVVVLANFSSTAFGSYVIGFPRPGSWRVQLNSDAKKYSGDFAGTPVPDATAVPAPHDGLAASASLVLPPYSVVVLSP
jgi:1,4-alpha-glucan branching enzyme